MRYLLTLEQYDSKDSLQDIRLIISDIMDEYNFTPIEYSRFIESVNCKSYSYIITDDEFKSEFSSLSYKEYKTHDQKIVVKLESTIDYSKRGDSRYKEELEEISKKIESRLTSIGCEVHCSAGSGLAISTNILNRKMLVFIDYQNINL